MNPTVVTTSKQKFEVDSKVSHQTSIYMVMCITDVY